LKFLDDAKSEKVLVEKTSAGRLFLMKKGVKIDENE
jgi:hypothetical protein